MTLPPSAETRKTAIAAALAYLIPVAASAQSQVLTLEEVFVTAQKREQSLQEVPVSITAFTADLIERAGISDFSDYAVKTPNVGFQQQGNRANTKFSIRGITNVGGQANSVGIYVDEVNVVPNVITTGQSRTADTRLLDIERIEVLRGPQGTFFGRNTMGGAINITTQKPDFEEVFGKVTMEVGEDEYYMVRGSANLPLSDTVALRGSAYYDEFDGFIDNKGPSGTSNSEENEGARLALRWQASDDLLVDVSASYSNMEQDFSAVVPTGILGAIPAEVVDVGGFLFTAFGLDVWPLETVPFHPDNFTDIATDMSRPQQSETYNFSARVEYAFGDMTLTSVTGYIDNDYEISGEGDMSIHPAFTVGRTSNLEAFSQEIRLASNGGDAINWMVGVIYSDDETEETDISTHLATDPYLALWDALGILEFGLPGDLGDILVNGPSGISVGNFEDVDRGSKTESIAAFADVSWDVSDELIVAAGLRYTYDEVEYFERTRPTIPFEVADVSDDKDFDDVSPRVNVTWLPHNELTVYGTVSKGYKVGGFNANQDLVDLFFKEETGWNYELGVKSTLWDSRLQLNASVFYFDWDDLQVRGQDVITQRQVVVNADAAHTQGLELEVKALLAEGLTLDIGYGYLEAEFDNFKNAIDTNGDLFDGSDNTITLAPENSFNAGLEYQFAIGPGDAYARVDYSFIDDQYTSADNNRDREIGSYELWNVRMGYDAQCWGVQAFVENLADEEYESGTENLETFYTGLQRTVGRPRWAGLRVDFRF